MADITYVPVKPGSVYVAVVLDAWSRRAVGYAISRSVDARLTVAAFNAAIGTTAAACRVYLSLGYWLPIRC